MLLGVSSMVYCGIQCISTQMKVIQMYLTVFTIIVANEWLKAICKYINTYNKIETIHL